MADSYLQRTTGTPDSQTQFTVSAWVKRSGLHSSNNMDIFCIYSDNSNRMHLRFQGDDIDVINYGGSAQARLTTDRKFRDTNAWYHIVWRVDTTLATADDRVRLYVNGVQETSFSTRTNPSQNFNFGTNWSTTRIGLDNSSSYFDGYISHIAYADGQSLAPTVFGETDSTSGIWKFKSPSGVTWGTNGFHLKFENSGALGTDSSGNSNTFTVNGNLKQSLDTPSNVHATLNSLIKSGYTITYSSGNTKATYPSSGWAGTLSNIGVSSGKWYWEGKMNTTGDNNFFGIMGEGVNMSDTSVHNETTGVVIAKGSGNLNVNNTASASYFSALSNGDIFSCALDLNSATKTIQFYKNGAVNGSAVNLPANMQTGFVFPAFVGNASSNAINHEVNFGNGFFGTTAITSAGSNGNGSLFEYDVPSGYYALNTKNINTYG